ncbi:MAG: amino acid adenylation domain-containing protein, partial [Acidobacteriota bacterium]
GVAIAHPNTLAMLGWAREHETAAYLNRTFFATSINFDISIYELFAPLITGGAVIVGDDALALIDHPHRDQVTLINTVPSAMAELARMDGVPPTVRVVNLAGEPLYRQLAEAVYAAGEIEGLYNLYGPSEDTTYSTFTLVRAGVEHGEPTIGRPLAGTRAHVLDKHLAPTPIGVGGELYLAGAGVSRGYLARPSLTAERYVPDPFATEPGSRLYRTGDRVRWRRDGELLFEGRLDHQVKIRGFRIELGEIEAVLLDLPEVYEAVVMPRGPKQEQQLVAWLARNDGGEEYAAIRGALEERLPGYMVPASFVVLDALPRLPNGKVDRKALPEPSRQIETVAYVAPRTASEAAVASAVGAILGVDTVGVHDDFFALGGHSLLATRLVSRLRAELEVELPLRQVFATSDVAGLAAAVDQVAGRVALPPITHIERAPGADGTVELPLSFAQERLWFLAQLEPDSPAYNIPAPVRLRGALDVEALESALTRVVARHEALRTVFRAVDETPVQVVLPTLTVPIELVDVESDEAMLAALKRAVGTPFDLGTGPLIRAHLFRRADDDHVLVLNVHHIVYDGWSVGILVREVTTFLAGRGESLPALAVQYGDVALWQREHLAPLVEDQMAWWREQLAGIPVLELPTDRPRPPVQTWAGDSMPMALSAAGSTALEALAREESTTLFMALLGAASALLSRWSGQDDFAIGSPIANRTRAEMEPLIGFFVNTRVLRTDVSGDPSFRELLARMKHTTLDAYAHQDVPFERLVAELAPSRDMAYQPLFQVMLTLQNLGAPDAGVTATSEIEPETSGSETDAATDHGAVSLEPVSVPSTTAKFDLSLSFAGHPDGIRGQVEWNTDLFDRQSIERFALAFDRLVHAATAEPDLPLSRLPWLEEEVRETRLTPPVAVTLTPPATIHERVFAHTVRRADAIAVSDATGTWTYGELVDRARRLASRLRAVGVGTETRVGLCLERGASITEAILGVLAAGGAYVPLDPSAPAERLAFILADAEIVVLITTSDLDLELDFTGTTIELDTLDPSAEVANAPVVVDPDQVAYVIYTSGSTGTPKGTPVTHRNVLRLFQTGEEHFAFGPDDVWTLFHSYAFDFSVWEIWGALLYGGRLVVVPWATSRDPEAFHRLLVDERVTVLNQTPSAFRQLLTTIEVLDADPDVLALREVIFGGEALELAALRPWFDRFGARVRMVNMYGITETTVHVTFRAVTPEDLVRSHLSPIGEALSDLAIYLLDRELQPAYDGAVGEIWVAGDGLARGYLGRPALTAERFVPDPYSGVAGARLYRSGDLARFSVDGELVYVGRADFQVKIRGFRIELGEIEASLSAHDDVDQAAVLVRGDEGDERLVAYLVPSTPGDEPDEAGPVDIAALRAHLAAALPEYMVPAAFLVMPSFPLTVNGKLDRKALPEPGGFERGEARFVAPRTATEISVAAVMADVLGVDQVGVHDDFFALGGHSLLATRLVARLRGELDLELPLRQVFTTPDVAGLAAAVDQASGRVALPPIRPVERRPEADGSVFLPLSFAQERLWFLAQLEPDSPAYNIPAPVRLRGALDIDALTAALNIVVSRHEALRTVFRELDGTPRQVVLPELAITIPVTDITVEDEIDSDDQLRTALVTEASTPFDLEHGPLLRARVYRFAADDHVLMLNVHHIVYDGWSVGLLVREIVASLADRPAMLPPLAVQYGDVAAWQHEHLAPLVDEQVQWWREQLAGVPVLELPTDRPRPAMQTWAGDSLPVMLSNEATTKLESLVREEGGTLFMALLGAVSVVLARWSGQVDFAVGAPIANRTRIEMEPLIGFFVNTLVLRADLDGEPTFRELLGRWKHTTLEAYAHQDVPFERLVAELAPARDMAHAPLFQVMLTLQNLGQPGPGSIGAEIETDSDADGVRLEPVTLESKTAKFDLSLSFSRQPDGLRGAIEWNTDLFDRATIERLGAHFVHLVEAAVEQPDRKARLLPLESIDSYRERVGVTTAYPRDSNIVEQFRATVAAHPDSIVLVTDEVELRRDELARRACRVARRLHAMGVGPDTPVAVFTERSVDMVVAMLGILGAGGCYVPFDPNDPDERLAWIAEDTGIQLALVTPALASRLPTAVEALAVETLSVETDAVEAGSDDAKDDPWPDVEILPDSLSNVIYTSGSTGRPKGVMVSHRNVLRLVLEADYADLGPDETFVQLSSPAFDVTTLEVWAPLLSGSRLVLPPPGVLALEEIGALLARHQISTLWLTAGLFHQMVDHRLDDLRGVRQLLAGGEALSVPHVERVLAELGETTMINGYGPTENTTFTTCHRMVPGSELDAATVPIGTPIADTTVHVLDADLRPVPIGVPGELVTGGDGVARGYLRRPRLTATVFIPDPFATTPGARLYRTGDRARWRDDGTLEFFGRIDRQIKLRGFRIEPGEIETALVSHPAVHTAVVLVREDQPGAPSPPAPLPNVVEEHAVRGVEPSVAAAPASSS